MKRVYVEEQWCLGCHLCEYNCAFANSCRKSVKSVSTLVVEDTRYSSGQRCRR